MVSISSQFFQFIFKFLNTSFGFESVGVAVFESSCKLFSVMGEFSVFYICFMESVLQGVKLCFHGTQFI